jgi:hypothetical protein
MGDENTGFPVSPAPSKHSFTFRITFEDSKERLGVGTPDHGHKEMLSL